MGPRARTAGSRPSPVGRNARRRGVVTTPIAKAPTGQRKAPTFARGPSCARIARDYSEGASVSAGTSTIWRLRLRLGRSASGSTAEPAAASASGPSASSPLAPLARGRLARWQRAIASEATRFAQLDDAARHRLRRRAKRLRYASEFVESLFGGKEMRRFAESLRAVQQALGELGDLALAARRYDRESAADPRDWFVQGWMAARRDVLAAQAAAALAGLAGRRPFGKR